jgi:hypothetical protein
MASILLPAPLMLSAAHGGRDRSAAAFNGFTRAKPPLLPLDTLPNENPNTPLAPVVPVVAVPSPKPKNRRQPC